MQNLSDNELDDLFRNASNQQGRGAEGVSTEWGRLASRLDSYGKTFGVWKLRAAFLSAIILSGIGLTVWWMSDRPRNQIESTKSEKLVALEGEQPVNKESGMRDMKTVTAPGEMKKSSDHDPGNVMENKTTRVEFVKEQNRIDIKNLAVDMPANSESIIVAAENDLTAEPYSEYEIYDNQNDVDVGEIENQSVIIQNHALSIRLLASPDFTSVGYSSPGKTGWNYGAMLEFHVSRRLSVAAGIIRSKKLYETPRGDYRGIPVEDLKGDCRIWDIPLNLYYHFTPVRRWSIYTGIGFSSYVMRKENYVYMMNTYYGPHKYELEVEKKNNEWFKMLNVSVGLERQLNSHLAIQVEPFLKAPLAGVGEGDVSLASFGAFISLKYNFIKK